MAQGTVVSVTASYLIGAPIHSSSTWTDTKEKKGSHGNATEYLADKLTQASYYHIIII